MDIYEVIRTLKKMINGEKEINKKWLLSTLETCRRYYRSYQNVIEGAACRCRRYYNDRENKCKYEEAYYERRKYQKMQDEIKLAIHYINQLL